VPDGLAIRRAETVTDVMAASALLDAPARGGPTRRFLSQADHHLLIAYADGEPAGMVSGVELTHPDKGTEMFLYELGVAEPFRRRGIGRRLVTALADLARDAGCYGMWVLTGDENEAALAAYRSAGGTLDPAQRMLSWTFACD
jgi:ribosomal protein S18 acetylase RimI-like enzyme